MNLATSYRVNGKFNFQSAQFTRSVPISLHHFAHASGIIVISWRRRSARGHDEKGRKEAEKVLSSPMTNKPMEKFIMSEMLKVILVVSGYEKDATWTVKCVKMSNSIWHLSTPVSTWRAGRSLSLSLSLTHSLSHSFYSSAAVKVILLMKSDHLDHTSSAFSHPRTNARACISAQTADAVPSLALSLPLSLEMLRWR